MAGKVTLSVCMIVRDEAARLPRALASVRGVAREFVVVDTGSRDNTLSVARALGARVLETPWTDDFAAARNVALEAARGDWILSLDADEELASGQKSLLAACMARRDVDAWNVLLRSRLAGAQTGLEFQHQFPRLFRNGLGIRFTGRVHEQIRPALDAAGARVQTSGIVLVHSGYDIDTRTRRRKLERNLALLQLDHNDRPDDGFVHFHLGETCSALGKAEEAVVWYERALAGPSLDRVHRATARQNLAGVLLKEGRLRDAAVQAVRALRTDRDALPAWLHLAAARIRLGQYERGTRAAGTYLKHTTRVAPENRTLGFAADAPRAWLMIGEARLRQGRISEAAEAVERIRAVRTEWAPCERLAARLALARGEHLEAIGCLRRAAEREPDYAAGWCELVRALVDHGDLPGALAAAGDAAARVEDAAVYRMQGLLRLRAQDFAAAVQSYESVLRLDGNAEDAHRKLAGLYRKLGDDGRACRHLEWLQRAAKQPAEAAAAG